MIPTLQDLIPKKSSFDVKLGLRTIKISLRPFCLKDQAWIQMHFDEVVLQQKILMHDVDVICRLVWHQLDVKSKAKISKLGLSFYEWDDFKGKKIKVNPSGYKRLLALLDEKSLIDALGAFAASRGLNMMQIEEIARETDHKKKLIGASFTI